MITKLVDEPHLSKEYRTCAVTLFKDLNLLEKHHENEWYWQHVVKPLKDGLDLTVVSFYNREGKTIYDYYLNENITAGGLSAITPAIIKNTINRQHWGQIWEPLLKAAGFFRAYLADTHKEIANVLSYASQKIEQLMSQYLGYEIENIAPLRAIPRQRIESEEIREADNHFNFYREILPQIQDNPSLLNNETKYGENSDTRLVLFTDKLGLIDSGERIREAQVVLYSATSMKHYR
ncbi:MAG: hypothetical protein GY757_04310 [bacterium]|nr:hypothetical protein [bacterium]